MHATPSLTLYRYFSAGGRLGLTLTVIPGVVLIFLDTKAHWAPAAFLDQFFMPWVLSGLVAGSVYGVIVYAVKRRAYMPKGPSGQKRMIRL